MKIVAVRLNVPREMWKAAGSEGAASIVTLAAKAALHKGIDDLGKKFVSAIVNAKEVAVMLSVESDLFDE